MVLFIHLRLEDPGWADELSHAAFVHRAQEFQNTYILIHTQFLLSWLRAKTNPKL